MDFPNRRGFLARVGVAGGAVAGIPLVNRAVGSPPPETALSEQNHTRLTASCRVERAP